MYCHNCVWEHSCAQQCSRLLCHMQLAWIEQEDKHFTQCHTRKVGYFHEIHKHSDRSAVFVDIHVSSSGHRHAFLVKVTSSSSKQPVQVPNSQFKFQKALDPRCGFFSSPSDIHTSTFISWLLVSTRMWLWKTVFWFGHSQACFS